MNQRATIILRIILALLGVLYFAIGMRSALYGFAGDGGETVFAGVSAELSFWLIDNHYRFYAGVFAATGIILMLSARNLAKYYSAALAVLFLTVVGGLSRLSIARPDVLSEPQVYGAIGVEVIVGLPLMYALWRSQKAH